MPSYVVTIAHVEASDAQRTEVEVEARDELGDPIHVTHTMLFGILMSALTHVQMSYADNLEVEEREDT